MKDACNEGLFERNLQPTPLLEIVNYREQFVGIPGTFDVEGEVIRKG